MNMNRRIRIKKCCGVHKCAMGTNNVSTSFKDYVQTAIDCKVIISNKFSKAEDDEFARNPITFASTNK
jgi:hypothetical protein